MKFPGQRTSSHYFPANKLDITKKKEARTPQKNSTYITGIDQVLVDIEAKVSIELLERYNLPKGSSVVMNEQDAHALYEELSAGNMISDQFAGGTIGNTIHNYSVLSDDKSVLFGTMSNDIKVKSYSYHYLCGTSAKVDLNYLQPVEGALGRCFTLVTDCGERTFAISKGIMDKLSPEYINKEIIQNSSALVIAAYLMRATDGDSITEAGYTALNYAKEANIPIVLTLGTHFLIKEDPVWWRNFINEYVTVLAMNEEEGLALTGFSDPLLASNAALELCDMVLATAGADGLYTAGYTEDKYKRRTTQPIVDSSIKAFNEFEFSRPITKEACKKPIKVFAHIPPYLGGPSEIKNTNGAGDAALSALLHDLSANTFHKSSVPSSSKHKAKGLCYSSFSQICKYANRAAYEVLIQHGARLSNGLPEREDSLEEAYWER